MKLALAIHRFLYLSSPSSDNERAIAPAPARARARRDATRSGGRVLVTDADTVDLIKRNWRSVAEDWRRMTTQQTTGRVLGGRRRRRRRRGGKGASDNGADDRRVRYLFIHVLLVGRFA